MTNNRTAQERLIQRMLAAADETQEADNEELLKEAATLIASLSADLAQMTQRAEDQWAGWIKADVARRTAEAALAKAVEDEREACARWLEERAEEHADFLSEDAPSPFGRHRAAMNDFYFAAQSIRARTATTEKEKTDVG